MLLNPIFKISGEMSGTDGIEMFMTENVSE